VFLDSGELCMLDEILNIVYFDSGGGHLSQQCVTEMLDDFLMIGSLKAILVYW
jgi:hypothetical protein